MPIWQVSLPPKALNASFQYLCSQLSDMVHLPSVPACLCLAVKSFVPCSADKLQDVTAHVLLDRQGQKRSKCLQGLPGGEGSSHPWIS